MNEITQEIKSITDREMLMFTYGALKLLRASYPDMTEIIQKLELYLFPSPIVFIDLSSGIK